MVVLTTLSRLAGERMEVMEAPPEWRESNTFCLKAALSDRGRLRGLLARRQGFVVCCSTNTLVRLYSCLSVQCNVNRKTVCRFVDIRYASVGQASLEAVQQPRQAEWRRTPWNVRNTGATSSSEFTLTVRLCHEGCRPESVSQREQSTQAGPGFIPGRKGNRGPLKAES